MEISQSDNVLEVGPGIGSLTHFINEKASKYTAVDIDQRMIDFLKIPYSNSNINFICNDIRRVDISNFNKIISNLPYNITTELIVYFIKNGINIDKLVLMSQTETYAHFSDISGKEYGPVSVLIHLYGNIKKIMTVKPGSFYPAPKCSSTVFVINRDSRHTLDECVNTYYVSKQLFLNRRKTIFNNLQLYLKDKEKALEVCEKLNIPITKRPEELSPEMYFEITKIVK